jgi:ABC-type multidrug transport system, ATPase and permease components
MIKTLTKSIREYKKPSLLAPLSVTGEVIMEVLIPFLMSLIIDRGVGNSDLKFILTIGLILIGCTCISLFCGFKGGAYAAEASAGFAKNLRKDMYQSVQNYSFTNIDKFSTSSLITRLTTDVANVQNAYQMIIRIAVRSPAMLTFSLLMAFKVNPRLSLVFLGIVPLLAIGLFFIIKKAHPIFEKTFKKYDQLNTIVQENLKGIRVVKAYVREEHEVQKFQNSSKDIYNNFVKAEKILAFNSPLMQFSIYTCILLISWFGAKLIVSDSMTTGQLMSLFAYAGQILMSLMMLSMIFVMIIISRASCERIVEVLNEESDITNPKNPIYQVKDGSICFKNVDFSYTKNQDKLVLKNINIDIKAGEIVGIVGGTGSSKSSLVQLIPRLYDVTNGEVLVGGIDVRNYDLESLRNEVAMVLQKNVLFSGTIKENLRWGNLTASDEEIIKACKLAQADEFIQTLKDKYDSHIEQGGANLSGGQRQRLCIARALLKKPKILILDDSTSAVDTKTDILIRKAFKEEIPETTKFIIAQRIASIEDADKIIILDHGQIQAIGDHKTLLKENKIYQEVYYSQTKGDE